MKPLATIPTAPQGIDDAPPVRTLRTPSRLNDFYELTKPRLNFMVLVTTMVGFYMASGSKLNLMLAFNALLGTALTAAGAGVLNQVIERRHDKLMPRTRYRPMPDGRVGLAEGTVYGSILCVGGILYLFLRVNALTSLLGLATVLCYVTLYTPMKRWTTLNTIVGAVSGAIPPVMGWTAVKDGIGPGAAVLFLILFFWQMPHFLAIAILYRKDYAAGGFKMLPVVDDDLSVTGRQIVLYGAALIPVTLMPTLIGMTGTVYFLVAVVMGMAYLSFGIVCAFTRQRTDARRLFFASISYLPILLVVMMCGKK